MGVYTNVSYGKANYGIVYISSAMAIASTLPFNIACKIVKILTPSLFHSGLMDLQIIISSYSLVSSSITTLTVHYRPLSISFQSIHLLVLSINIVTLGSSSINHDFILTSYYPSNRCFTQKLSIPDYYIVLSYFIILYMFHFYLGI